MKELLLDYRGVIIILAQFAVVCALVMPPILLWAFKDEFSAETDWERQREQVYENILIPAPVPALALDIQPELDRIVLVPVTQRTRPDAQYQDW